MELHSEYKPGVDKPHAVTVWEARITNAESYEAALLQLTYQQLVETRKLRVATLSILGLLVACVVVGVIGLLVLISSIPGI